MLNYFGWNVFIPSPAHYVELFMKYALNDEEDFINSYPVSQQNVREIQECLEDFIQYFLDIAMQVGHHQSM